MDAVPLLCPTRIVRAVARTSGHLRLVVWGDVEPLGVVHVRDALARRPARPPRS